MPELPKYYFQDIPEDGMEHIVSEMDANLSAPSHEGLDHWLNCTNVASTIPQWYESVGEFVSAHRYTLR